MAADQTEQVGILKSMWRKNEAGKWVIHDIKGIELRPREGFSKDFFKIKDELVLLTQRPGLVFNNLFASFGMTEFLVRQSIVPIVAWSDGDEEVRCIGTGFFISPSGYLLTAAHVLRDPVDENYSSLTEVAQNQHKLSDELHFGVLLPANPAMRTAPPELGVHPAVRESKWFMCPFEWAHHWGSEIESPLVHQKPEFKLTLDIAVCKVREHPVIGPYQPLGIGLHDLAVGDRAVAIGYSEMRNIRLKDDDYQPDLMVSVGSVTTVYPDNISEKQSPTPGPNFEFNARIPGRMSGAPILVGGAAIAKGVVSRSYQDENYASGCMIAPVMSLPLVSGKSLHDLQISGDEGIGKMVGKGL